MIALVLFLALPGVLLGVEGFTGWLFSVLIPDVQVPLAPESGSFPDELGITIGSSLITTGVGGTFRGRPSFALVSCMSFSSIRKVLNL